MTTVFRCNPASKYALSVQTNLAGHPNQWYGGASQATATVINFSANTTINLPLAGTPSVALSGKVTTSGGPLAGGALVGVKINIYDAIKGTSLSSVTSTSGVSYTINLAAGSYKLYIQPNKGYPNQWYGGTSLATATIITRVRGDDTGDRRAHLATSERAVADLLKAGHGPRCGMCPQTRGSSASPLGSG